MAKYKIIPSSRTIVQSPISIGHKAEKGVEAIEFDLTAWVETYGSGTLTVIMRRWGDAIPYPIALEIDENNKATWTLSNTDTAKAGMAYAQLSYIVGDEVVKKSDIYTFRVMDSLTGEGDPPEAYESWLEHLTHLAAEAMAEVLDIEGIVTDKTLTVDGGIADAKATGDALSALEDQFSKETDQLKADLGALSDFATIEKVGTLNASFSGNPSKIKAASYSRTVYGLVGTAKSVTVTKTAGSTFIVGFTSATPANGVTLIDFSKDMTAETITADVPEGAKFVVVYCFNSNTDTGSDAVTMVNSVTIMGLSGAADVAARDYISTHSADIENGAEFLSEMAFVRESVNLFNGVLTEGYISADGVLHTPGYLHTDKIDVHERTGETIKVWNGGAQKYIRFVCAYSKSGLAVSSLGTNTNGQTYTIPDGAYYVVLSLVTSQLSNYDLLITTSEETLYIPSAQKWGIDGYDAVNGAVNIPMPVKLATASLVNGQRIVGAANSVKRLGSYVLYCKPGELTEDNYIIFGKDSRKGYAVGISSTKLAWFKNDSIIGSVAHGLTIADYLFVTVDKVPGTGAVVNVYTNGGHYSRTNTSWTDDHGAPYVYNNSGGTITDVKMTWTSSALRNRNWIFGDSYVSIAETRWTKYVYDLGFGENLMLNGYPGEQTAAGYADFMDCLKRGKPSAMAWCLGMNDADSEAINSSWLSHTQAFLRVCQLFGITPILATIPCCPIADHQYKNAWVRASGYRYIDFANAVNVTENSTTWYEGMLADDNIHPTAQGAIALASQVLTDFPELLID